MKRSIHILLFLCLAMWANAQHDERSVSMAISTDTIEVGEAFTITWSVKGAVEKVEVMTGPEMPAVSQPGLKSARKWLDGIRSDETTYTVRVLALRAGAQAPPILKVIWQDDEKTHLYEGRSIFVKGKTSASDEQMLFRFALEQPEGAREVHYHNGIGYLTERKNGKDELVRYLSPKEVKRLEKLLR